MQNLGVDEPVIHSVRRYREKSALKKHSSSIADALTKHKLNRRRSGSPRSPAVQRQQLVSRA